MVGVSCMVSLSIFGLSIYGDNVLSNTCYIFLPLILLHYYSQVATISTIVSDRSVNKLVFDMLSLNPNKKVTCENCGSQATSQSLPVTRRVVLLVLFIVFSVPVCPQNHKMM